ncbi:unnamed protein product, partial [Hapterophycus canaliculatus]
NPLLLDLSPERESRAARAVEGRRKATAEAIRGAKLALRDLADWKKSVLSERGAVVAFMRRADPALAFVAGASCDGADGAGGDGYGASQAGLRAKEFEVDVVVADPSFLAAEGAGGWAVSDGGRGRRHASWAGAGDETPSSSNSSPTSDSATVDSGDGSVERPTRDRSSGRGGLGTRSSSGGGGGGGRSRVPATGFLRALGALDPCVSALREARSSAKTGDRLSAALETLREHVKATLIDLMDLETSIPGEAGESDGEETASAVVGGDGGGGGGAGSVSALTAAEAGSLDVKVAGLVKRLCGKEGSGDGASSADDGGNPGGPRGPPSLASVYEGGLRGAAEASEAEVDTTESLTARALGMVITAAAGPLLWALDDAYQRLVKADLDLRRLLPEAEALVGGAGSAEELAREARGRLVTVVDEQDLLKELVSKLKRRRRQAAEQEEIRAIDDERLHALARVSALRSAKLSELKALRRSGAYQRFPELLLEQPDPAESAFRSLLLSGIDVRDVDEWGEHHLTSVASVESIGDGGVRKGGGMGGVSGAGGTMLAGLGGHGCRLAEIDGSAVALVEVDCRDRQSERALVADILSFNPRDRRLPPEVATVSAVSLQDGKALLEVCVEGALTAKAWLAASSAGSREIVADGDRTAPPVPPATIDRMEGEQAPPSTAAGSFTDEEFQVGVWAVMVQALRGLAAVHALHDGSVHGAVNLANILVAARSNPKPSARQASAASTAAGGGPSSPPAPTMPHGFRRAQLGPPSPAALARPSAACVAPEVVRGRDFCQPADIYAFGCALRAACCGAQHPESYYATGGDGGGRGSASGGSSSAVKKASVLPVGLGPAPGPLREALVQLLERMLEEDAPCRCTALEALSSDYFR